MRDSLLKEIWNSKREGSGDCVGGEKRRGDENWVVFKGRKVIAFEGRDGVGRMCFLSTVCVHLLGVKGREILTLEGRDDGGKGRREVGCVHLLGV